MNSHLLKRGQNASKFRSLCRDSSLTKICQRLHAIRREVTSKRQTHPEEQMRLARLTVAFVLISAASAAAQAPLKHLPPDDSVHRQQPVDHVFHTCPIGGKSSRPHPGGGVFDPDLNALKNRVDQPSSYLDIKLSAILELASPMLNGKLRSRWVTDSLEDAEIVASYEGLPVRMEGYLVVDRRYHSIKYAAQEQGKESTNCGVGMHKADVHVWVTSKKNQNMTRAIVVELTPRVREALGQDSSRVEAQKLVAAARRGLRVRKLLGMIRATSIFVEKRGIPAMDTELIGMLAMKFATS